MIRLYERAPTRSDRVTWTLLELDHDAELIEVPGKRSLHPPELKDIHPLSRVPAMDADGEGLFESAAICTYLADKAPEKGLVAASGTWERAQHDQWVSFALTEMEAWAWSTFRSMNIIAYDKKVPEMYAYNKEAYREGATALNEALRERDFLVADTFSVTDIIVSWTCQFGQNRDYNEGFENIAGYLARVKARPHCTLKG